MVRGVRNSDSPSSVAICMELPQSVFLIGCVNVNDAIASRLISQLSRESQKLKKYICQNMFDDMEKHREGHRILQKMRFIKEASSLVKSFPQHAQN